MKNRFVVPLSIAFFLIVVPMSLAIAQSGSLPLVPCNGLMCQACDLAALIQRIVKFAILFAIPVAAALFAYAGALYITARGDTGQISKATKIFGNVALGFILALSGWLIINTILIALVDKKAFSGGDWFSIQCVADKDRNKTATLKELLGSLQPAPAAGSCAEGSTASGTGVCKDNATGAYTLASGYKCPDDMKYFSSVSGMCGNEDGSKTGPPTRGGGTTDDQVNRKALTDNGITITSSGDCADRSNPKCTSLDGLQSSALGGALSIKSSCGCNLNITAGTEVGHSETGTYTHSNGYKLDFRLDSQLDSYITSWTYAGKRSGDNADMYKDGSTVCAKEGDHWDCMFP